MPTPSRRSLLAVVVPAGALALAGCGGVRFVPGTETTPTAVRGPDDDARDAALAQTRTLAGSALALRDVLAPAGPVATASLAHLQALGDTATRSGVVEGPATDPAATLAADLAAALTGAQAAAGPASPALTRLLVPVALSRALLLDDLVTATGTPAPAPAGAAPGTGAGASEQEQTAAWQRLLAGEHAAVHAYGLVAGRLGADPRAPRRAEALADLDAHRVARDDLVDLLLARGADPVAAAAGYDADAATPPAAAALAAAVEERLTALQVDVAAATTGADRTRGADGALVAARAARRWGSSRLAFPGRPDLPEDGTSR